MSQGWTQADYHCGRCGHTFKALTERTYLHLLNRHQQAHEVWDQMTPEQRTQMSAQLAAGTL